jgi:UDP-N-acetylmuramate: L-alanyl-gamma-D-glutamyl-meso-diaminopimelate ligase
VAPPHAAAALARFGGVKRRLEVFAEVGGITLYDDFAHHPTAIETTLAGLRRQGAGRLIAVLEPRSNTMRMGVHRDRLAASLRAADGVYLYRPEDLGWDLDEVAAAVGGVLEESVEALVARLAAELRPGDRVVIMSNGAFGGLHQRLERALRG